LKKEPEKFNLILQSAMEFVEFHKEEFTEFKNKYTKFGESKMVLDITGPIRDAIEKSSNKQEIYNLIDFKLFENDVLSQKDEAKYESLNVIRNLKDIPDFIHEGEHVLFASSGGSNTQLFGLTKINGEYVMKSLKSLLPYSATNPLNAEEKDALNDSINLVVQEYHSLFNNVSPSKIIGLKQFLKVPNSDLEIELKKRFSFEINEMKGQHSTEIWYESNNNNDVDFLVCEISSQIIKLEGFGYEKESEFSLIQLIMSGKDGGFDSKSLAKLVK
jgi:hypothetical protein